MVIKLDHFKTESELIAACIKGNRKAQKQLFDEQASVMLTVCQRYAKDADTAEELMITGFGRVFEKLDQFKSEGSFQGWIRRIMVNNCLSWIRKNKEMYLEVELDKAMTDVDIDQVDQNLQAEDLMKLIEDLPQGYRTIFNLYAIEGYTHEEISVKLEISTGTSKSQLSRARKLLQQRLAQLEENEGKQRKNGR